MATMASAHRGGKILLSKKTLDGFILLRSTPKLKPSQCHQNQVRGYHTTLQFNNNNLFNSLLSSQKGSLFYSSSKNNSYFQPLFFWFD
jgi:hypothetical protein